MGLWGTVSLVVVQIPIELQFSSSGIQTWRNHRQVSIFGFRYQQF